MQSVERFTSRVDNYVRYRPGYPAEIVALLNAECGLTADSVVADIGSGSGKLSEIFLANGNEVIAVEPNDAMRMAARQIAGDNPRIQIIDGTAENTTLPDSSIDFVIAGQAFHWFDPRRTKTEWNRILKPEGWAVLIWNERLTDSTAFLREYEKFLIEFGTDYPVVRHENATDAINFFFAPTVPRLASFPNVQVFDYQSLKGRLLSTSYTPEQGHPSFDAMLNALTELFAKYEENGVVRFEYETRVYYGQL